MTLAYPLLPEPIGFSEDGIRVLVIEHTQQLRGAVLELKEQLGGSKGKFVLAEKEQLLELSKSAVLVTDPFSLELDTKRILTKINQDACRAGAEYAPALQEILARLGQVAAGISTMLDYDVCFEVPETWDELIKVMGFRIDTQALSLPEQVLEFMKLQRLFFGKKLFVFYNLKACLSGQELAAFYRSVQYEKLHVLLLEDTLRKRLPEQEKTVVVDEDLCVF